MTAGEPTVRHELVPGAVSSGRPALGRRAGALALALPLAGAVVVTAATPAAAAISSPGDGSVYTSYGTLEIRASYERSSSENRLTLTSPGGPAVTVATAPAGLNGGTLSYSLDTGCWTYPSSACSGRRLAPNGTWTVTQTGGGSGSVTFTTRIAPQPPQSVTAAAVNAREIRVGWRKGDEPDLTGWAVFEGASVVTKVTTSACDGGTCSTLVGYASDGSGEHTYTVRAFRAVAPGSTSTLESPMSSSASARLDPPSPSPSAETPRSEGGSSGGGSTSASPGPSGSAGSSGGSEASDAGASGGTTGDGSATPRAGGTASPGGAAAVGTGKSEAQQTADEKALAQRKSFPLTFSAFGPNLGMPKMPPLPQASEAAPAPELADGAYEPTLGFEDQVVREEIELTQAPREPSGVVAAALDSERLTRSTAGALVLLLAGAHLRRWLLEAARER
jgi:hypothetical protein